MSIYLPDGASIRNKNFLSYPDSTQFKMSNARNAKKSSNSPSEPSVPKNAEISRAKLEGDSPTPCNRCKVSPGQTCTKCAPPAPSPCIVCGEQLTYFKANSKSKPNQPLRHVQTNCTNPHFICYGCVHGWKKLHYERYSDSLKKTPVHDCIECGMLNMRISPFGESPDKPHTFYAADQVDVFGKVGICHSFPPSLLHAVEEMTRLNLTLPEILSAIAFASNGFPAKARIPISLEKYRNIIDIMDQVNLVAPSSVA